MDLFTAVAIVWKQKLLFAGILFACTALSIAIALLKTEYFRSTVVLSPNPAAFETPGGVNIGGSGFLSNLAGFTPEGPSLTSIALERLQSKAFFRTFLDERNLMPVLFAEEWDAGNEIWKDPDPDARPTFLDAYEVYTEEILNVLQEDDTGIVRVSVDWTDAVTAKEWAEDLVARLNREMKARALEEARTELAFLGEELAKTQDAAVREAIVDIMREKMVRAMNANTQEHYAFKIIDPPVVADDEERPKKVFIAFAGGVLGGILGLVAVFTRENLRRRKAALAATQSD